jgi:hypothetical protein
MNNYHAFNAELIVQAQHIFELSLARCVLAIWCQWVVVCPAEYVCMAVAAADRQHCVWRLMKDAVDGG